MSKEINILNTIIPKVTQGLNSGSIDTITTKLKTFGVASPNKFRVLLFPPSIGRKDISFFTNSQFVSMSCVNASLPGKTFQTVERRIKGPHEKIPYAKSYEDVTLSFLVSQQMQEKIFFDKWQDFILDPVTFELNYYDEYISTVRIQQLDKSLNVVYEIELHEAYPMTVSALTLDSAASSEIHKIDVTFAYRTWEDTNTFGFLPGISGKLPKFGGLGISDAIKGINKLSGSNNNYSSTIQDVMNTSNIAVKAKNIFGNII